MIQPSEESQYSEAISKSICDDQRIFKHIDSLKKKKSQYYTISNRCLINQPKQV